MTWSILFDKKSGKRVCYVKSPTPRKQKITVDFSKLTDEFVDQFNWPQKGKSDTFRDGRECFRKW